MDLNDPKRRLQVLNNANPSLRVAVAPAPKLKVSTAPARPLTVRTTPAQQNAPLRVASSPAEIGTVPERVTPIVPELKPQTGLNKFLNIFKPISEGGINAFADAGNFVRDAIVKPTIATGETLANVGASSLIDLTSRDPNLRAAARAQTQESFERSIPGAIMKPLEKIGATFGAIGAEQSLRGQGVAQEHITQAINDTTGKYGISTNNSQLDNALAIGGAFAETGLNLAAPGAPQKIGAVKGALASKEIVSGVKNLFESADGFVNNIIKESRPDVIKQALNVDDQMASYLAQESNPELIKNVLRELEVDPNLQLSDEVRRRLAEEGISKVEKRETEYGAEYQDGTIGLRDQSFATDENINHELGHHIFQNKLTPEEKALFKGEGDASKSAVGREGYTPEDVNSEDFSDYLSKALSGRLNEVPEQFQDVIAKYAKVAKTEAGETGAKLPEATAPVQTTQDDVQRALETGDITKLMPTPETKKLDEVEMTTDIASKNVARAEEVSAAAKKPVDEATPTPVDEVAEGIAKTQTGVVDDAAKTLDETAPAAKAAEAKPEKGIVFRDPVTKKNTERTYDDVKAELEKLKNLPEDQVDAKVRDQIRKLETKMARYRSANAKYAFPDADEPTRQAIQEVMDQLSPAERNLNRLDKTRAQEKAARISQGGNNYEAAGGGESGFRAKLSALKGKQSESNFNPITASEATQKTLLDDIEKSNLREFEKLNTQNALRKIWGATDAKPTKGDIKYIRKYFGDDMADKVDEAIEEGGKNWRDKLVDIAGLPRAMMASFDFSMGLRQGGQVAIRNPKQWLDANVESVKYVKNTQYFNREMKKIANDDAYETITDKLGVRLPAVDGNSDEIMASAHMLEKVPVYGKGIAASDRAYSGGLTKLRYNIAKSWIDSVGGTDAFLKKFSDQELKDIGEVINTSTGSGGKPGGFTERHMQTLSTTLFAPRLWASRLNSLNPAYYARLSPVARRRAMENMGSFLAAASGVVLAAKMAGADVEMDPRSSDFMKIKVGNTRYDVFGGLQQNVVFATRMITGEKKNSASGEIATLGDGFGAPNRFDLGVDMLQNKLNPLLGYMVRLMQSSDNEASDNPVERQDRFGEEMNVLLETAQLGIPLGVQGLADTTDDTGNFAQATAMNVPNFFGISTQTYGDVKTKDQGKPDATGKLAFKGKITDEMVLKDDGTPYLDDKGRPVKVEFGKDATELEKKALKDDKAKSLKTDEYKKSLSTEDQALLKLDEKELDEYLEDGDITEAQYDRITEAKQKIKNLDGIEVDENIKSDNARRFYEKYNSLTEKQKEAWMEAPASENSQQIAKTINAERSEGLSEFKPSQKLAKLYAEYEQKINSNKELSEIDKRNEAKKFQVAARKLNESTGVNDLYNEGGSGDMRTLINEGQIDKAELDAAIALDNELYNSKLVGTLKFSKTFRRDHGYGVPDGVPSSGKGYGKGGSGGKGSGDETVRAQLASLLPSEGKSGGSAPAPQFSKKRRTEGISFKNVNTPKSGNSRKVTIKL